MKNRVRQGPRSEKYGAITVCSQLLTLLMEQSVLCRSECDCFFLTLHFLNLLLALFFFLDRFAFLNMRINCVIVGVNIGARVCAIQNFQPYLVVILVRRCAANFRARARLKWPLHAPNKYLEALPTAKVRAILKHVICVGVQGPV